MAHTRFLEKFGISLTEANGSPSPELDRFLSMIATLEKRSCLAENVARIAHDFKNVLHVISLQCEQLREALDRQPDAQQGLNNIQQVIRSGNQLIAQIISDSLDMACADLEEQTVFNPEHVLTELESEFDQLVAHSGKEVRLYTCRFGENAMIRANREKVKCIFKNLFVNAIQALPETRTGRIIIHLEADDSNFHIAIADNGQGMPIEHLEHIYKPTFTTKASGTGFGLFFAKVEVERLLGRIECQSEVGQGTIFDIYLPLSS